MSLVSGSWKFLSISVRLLASRTKAMLDDMIIDMVEKPLVFAVSVSDGASAAGGRSRIQP